MDEAANSDSDGAASSDLYAATPTPQEDAMNDSPAKRKHGLEDRSPSPSKRRRRSHSLQIQEWLSAPVPELPLDVWQRVFMFVEPKTLITVLRVNQSFRACLSRHHARILEQTGLGLDNIVDPEAVWAASRRIHHPWLPEPLPGRLELEMWKLIGDRSCDHCGVSHESSDSSAGSQEQFPMVAWPFYARLCRECLHSQTEDEPSLFFSDLSTALPLTPFAFLCGHRLVPTISLSKIGPAAEIKKVYYKPMLEDIQAHLHSDQFSREQYQTLQRLREDIMQSVREWEHCDEDGRLDRHGGSNPASFNSAGRGHAEQGASLTGSQRRVSETPDSAVSAQPPRPSNIDDANEAKAARREEIERRCMELDPPLSPGMLQHMDSFHAAVQISHELTDRDWQILKPRLAEQRHAAQRRVQEQSAAEVARLGTPGKERSKDPKDSFDSEWEMRQRPVRDKLSAYADEVISNSWADGKAVNHDTSPKFAAEVLLYVRKRFYADLAKDDYEPQAQQMDIDTQPVRVLVLDHMRWVWHTKVKVLTEQYRKAPFVCSACNDRRFFAFESVIQHYATKHTHTFSSGQVTVQWKTAEWPDTPPFAPDPNHRAVHLGRNSLQSNVSHVTDTLRGVAPRPFFVPMTAAHGMLPIAAHSPGPPGNPGYGTPYGGFGQGPFSSPAFPYPPPKTPFVPDVRFPIPPSPVQSMLGWPQAPFVPVYSPNHYASSPFNPPAPPNMPTLYDSQLDVIAYRALEIWSLISGHRKIPDSVKIHVVIFHAISHFRARFSNEPSLNLFSDFLGTHHLMASSHNASTLKNAGGLACKTCVLKNEDLDEAHSSPSFHFSGGGRKLYPFYSLLQHFKNVHEEKAPAAGETERDSRSPERLDWREDMIELPEPDLIKNLQNLPDMDAAKWQLIEEAFPDLFIPVEINKPLANHGNTTSADTIVSRERGRFQSSSPRPQGNRSADKDYRQHHRDIHSRHQGQSQGTVWQERELAPSYHGGETIDAVDSNSIRIRGLGQERKGHTDDTIAINDGSPSGIASRQTSRGSVYRDLHAVSISDPYRQPRSRVDSPSSHDMQLDHTGRTLHADNSRVGSSGGSRPARSPSVRDERRVEDVGQGRTDANMEDRDAAERFFEEIEYERELRLQQEHNGRRSRSQDVSAPGQAHSRETDRILHDRQVDSRFPLNFYDDEGSRAYSNDGLDHDAKNQWRRPGVTSTALFPHGHQPISVGLQPRYYYYDAAESEDSRMSGPAGRSTFREVPPEEGVEFIPLRSYEDDLHQPHQHHPESDQHLHRYRK